MLKTGCEPACPGCSHRELSDQESAASKQAFVARTFSSPVFRGARVASLRAGDVRYGYREKICLRARWVPEASGGRWLFGFLKPAPLGSRLKPAERELVAIHRCPIQTDRVSAALEFLSRALPREIPLAFVQFAGQLVTLIFKAAEHPQLPDLGGLERLGFTGLWVNLNPVAGNRVLNPKGFHLIWGSPRATAEDSLPYGPSSFSQVLPELHEETLDRAVAHLAPDAHTAVIDLCSGRGASLLRWREQGAEALGVELSGESVSCAESAGLSILRGLCSQRLPQLEAWLATRPERVLYANPPRLGLEPEVIRWILERAHPKRIAYLSCSPATLARDLELLARDYEIAELIPYDFFPNTHHVETLALMVRR